ncbi:hypothetical protein BDY19DRAFT_923981 [Irpex rosettiformis]|uniref:Uncharacterized protein n=1 Tax=Irpex rosettiformis TaxID=378272 RepID=A0ACB8UGL6_9APHY|nr:hypothetical protein BDY19DRAFT_923981 [Irpex rosettiformis]
MSNREVELDSELQALEQQPGLLQAPEPRDDDYDELSQHNASQPMLRLSNEVLGIIFELLREISPLRLSYPKDSLTKEDRLVAYRLGWVGATHVCRRMRQVALLYPALWSKVVVRGSCIQWLPEVLQRSREMPIEFDLFSSTEDRGEVLATLLQPTVMSRVKSLFTRDNHWLPVLRVLLNNPAPHLENLDLTLEESYRMKAMLPEELFSSCAPCIRRLSLKGFDLTWSSFAFPTLTHLSIIRPAAEPGDTYSTDYIWKPNETHKNREHEGLDSSMKRLVNTLRSLPLLQHLTLEHALPTKNIDIADLPRISLPHLKKLAIKHHTSGSCFSLLGLLDVEQLRYFKLVSTVSAKPRGEISRQYHRPLSQFLSNVAHRSPTPITGLNFGFHKDALTLIADVRPSWIKERYQPYCPIRGCTIFGIFLCYAKDSGSPEVYQHRHACLEPILDALPLSELDYVSFKDRIIPEHWGHIADYALWNNILDRCSSAHEVRSDSIAITFLLPLLASRNISTWSFPTPPEPRTPAFPLLEELSIVTDERYSEQDYVIKRHFAEGVEMPAKETFWFPYEVFLDAIRQCLLSRSGYVPLLKKLYIYIPAFPSTAEMSSRAVSDFTANFAETAEEASLATHM